MLNWDTVDNNLKHTLLKSMAAEEFRDFRLVGGTALSLQLGHRVSEDIDLFTDAPYGSVSFESIENYLIENYAYLKGDVGGNPGMGRTYRVGADAASSVKLDVYYSMDPFFQPPLVLEGIKMATAEEIIAMKVDIVMRNGRKKDFWDLHELLNAYSIDQMVAFHQARFEWTHDGALIRSQFTNFTAADEDVDPICLLGKEWAFIKQDFNEALGRDRSGYSFSR